MPFIQNCLPPDSPLINGGFEQGETGWSTQESDVLSGQVDILPHSGNFMVAIHGNGGTPGIPEGKIEQTFSVPICGQFLSFWWNSYVACGWPRCSYGGTVTMNGIVMASLGLADGWQEQVIDVSSFRGSNVTMVITALSYRTGYTVYVDDIGFTPYP